MTRLRSCSGLVGLLALATAAPAWAAAPARHPVAQPPNAANQPYSAVQSQGPQGNPLALTQGDLFLAGQHLFTLAPVGDLGVVDRANIVRQNLLDVLAPHGKIVPVDPQMIALRTDAQGEPVIYLGDRPIVTVSDADVALAHGSADELAGQWAANLGTALAFLQVGQAPSPDLVALRGPGGLSIGLSQTQLANQVAAALSTEVPAIAPQIDVQDQGGVIYLNGAVNTLAQRDEIERVTSTVPGVTGLVDTISVIPAGGAGTSNDQSLTQQAQQLLVQSSLPDVSALSVSVSDGVATLAGAVATLGDRHRADDLLSTLDGVTRIDDSRVAVAPPPVSDTGVEQELATTLDQQVPGLQVQVAQGVATLKGTVDTLAARQQAERIAENTTGVQAIDNRITVQPASS